MKQTKQLFLTILANIMIRFIDIKTGNTYNGESPYVHYFDDQQSVNIFYVRQICFVSTSQACTVTMEDNDVFKFANLTSNKNETSAIKANMETIDEFNFVDKDKQFLRNKANKVDLLVNELKLDGYLSSYGSLYMLYVVGCSSSAGEFHQTITIKESNKEVHTIEVAADFTSKDETLSDSMVNIGVEMSNDIQRAIYESDVREDAYDEILLNRKYKELLLNSLDIIGGKGNYNSLERSLSWFEYGDKLKLAEFWHKNEAGREFLNKQELSKIVDDKIKGLIINLWKTTYIGIVAPINKWVKTNYGWTEYESPEAKAQIITDENGNVLTKLHPAYLNAKIKNATESYDRQTMIGGGVDDFGISDWKTRGSAPSDDFTVYGGANLWRDDSTSHELLTEPIPELYSISFIWSRDILMLKTALVAKYFSRYFIPIHIDVLYGAVEELIYTNTLKLTYDSCIQRNDNVGKFNSIQLSYGNNDIFLQNNKLFIDGDTPFGLSLTGSDIIGVEYIDNVDAARSRKGTYFDGISVVIPYVCKIEGLSAKEYITKAEINIAYSDDGVKSVWLPTADNSYITYDEGTATITFNIALRNPGTPKISLLFTTNYGSCYTRTHSLIVHDTVNNEIDIYKVHRFKYSTLLKNINNENPKSETEINPETGEEYAKTTYDKYESLLDCDEILKSNDFADYTQAAVNNTLGKERLYVVLKEKTQINDIYCYDDDWINVTDGDASVIRSYSLNQIAKKFNIPTANVVDSNASQITRRIINEYASSSNAKRNFNPATDLFVPFRLTCKRPTYTNGKWVAGNNNVLLEVKLDSAWEEYASCTFPIVDVPQYQHLLTCSITDDFTNNIRSVGFNHVFRIKPKNGSFPDNFISNNLMQDFEKYYWWYIIDARNDGTDAGITPHFVGIRKFYTNDSEKPKNIITEKANNNTYFVVKWDWDVTNRLIVSLKGYDENSAPILVQGDKETTGQNVIIKNSKRVKNGEVVGVNVKKHSYYFDIDDLSQPINIIVNGSALFDNDLTLHAFTYNLFDSHKLYDTILEEVYSFNNKQSKIRVNVAWDHTREKYIKIFVHKTDDLVVANHKITINGTTIKECNCSDRNYISVYIDAVVQEFYKNDVLPLTYEFDIINSVTGRTSHKTIEYELQYFDFLNVYGTDNYKEHLSSVDLESYTIEENKEMFIPTLNTYDILDELKISQSDLVFIKPQIEQITLAADDVQWQFVNKSTGNSFYPVSTHGEIVKSLKEPFFTNNASIKLEKGLYKIILTYSLNGQRIIKEFDNYIKVVA